MPKILKLNQIAKEGLSVFPIDEYELGTEMQHPDAIILRSFKMHDMELPATLLAVARAGAGVNNIPVEKCSEKGIVVFNSPGANANAVKEITIGALLLAARDIVGGMAYCQSLIGKGAEVATLAENNKATFAGTEIFGKTIGIVGLGKIGVMVANACIDLGMNVIGYDPFISIESAWGLSRDVKRAGSLDGMLSQCDYISMHMPLTDTTKGMLNADKFAVMKKGVKIVNYSRGGIVNDKALLEAAEKGIVSTYVTDFPEDELLGKKFILATPHLGASTAEAETNCSIIVSRQLKDFLERGNIKNSVNFPDCQLDQSAPFRLTVMNKNIPNMVGQISTILAKSNVNIVEMLNKSKGDYAYNIIDMGSDIAQDVVDALYKIEGVIKVRTIKLA